MSQNPHKAASALLALGLLGASLLLNVLLYLWRPRAAPTGFDQMATLSLDDHQAAIQLLLQRARSIQAWSQSTKSPELTSLSEGAWLEVLERIFEIDRPRPEAPLLDQEASLQAFFAEARDHLYGPKSQREADSLLREFKARAAQARACTERSRRSREAGAELDRQTMIRRAKLQWQRIFGLLTLLQSNEQYSDGLRFKEPLHALEGILAQSRKMLHDLTLEARPGDFDSAQFNAR